MPCYKIHITGTVFKNGFRYFLKSKASLHEITGKVYYTNGSSVEVIASGEREKMEDFLKVCTEGNQLFQVTGTNVAEIPDQEYSTFEVEDEFTNER